MKRLAMIVIFYIFFVFWASNSWATATNSGLVTFDFGGLLVESYDAPQNLGSIYYYGDAWGFFGSISTPPYSGAYTLNSSNFVNATWAPTSMSWNATLQSPGPSGPNPNQGLIYAGGADFLSKVFLSSGNDLNLKVTYSFNGTADSLYDGTRIWINILEVGYGSTVILVETPIDNNVGTAYEVDLSFPTGTYGWTDKSFELNFIKTDTDNWWVRYYVSGHIDEYAPIGGGPTPVPEPSTMLLLGSGLMGLAGYGRRKFFKK